MSYDVSLVDSKTRQIMTVPIHNEGGICSVGGTELACLNITYNYGPMYATIKVSLRSKTRREKTRPFNIYALHGHRAIDTVPILLKVAMHLGARQDANYYACTPGNAGYAATILLNWAILHPDAEWNVS